jgi:murein DD-endopeptidase MepM/ murein hydrolase activator NlpD
VTATARPAPRTPTLAPTPESLVVALDPPQVGNGESMRVLARAGGATKGTVQFRGIEHSMVPLGDGTLWTVVAAPVLQTLGRTSLAVTVRNAADAVIGTAAVPTAIVAVDRPVQYLQATAEQVSVLTPDAAAREEAIRAQYFASFDRTPRWDGLFIRPTPGVISTQFGEGRSINNGPVTAQHSGVDFADDHGTPVELAAAGRVVFAGAMPIRGNSVVVDHGGGVQSGYHHLSRIYVQEGHELPTGTVVGAVGMTGFATGPHLHWEVAVWGVNVDAMTWLTTKFAPQPLQRA